MQCSSTALAVLRRSARKTCGAWSCVRQQPVKAASSFPQGCIEVPLMSRGDLAACNDLKPALKSCHGSEKLEKVIGSKCLGHRGTHEGCVYRGGQPSNLMFSNSYMTTRRHFASGSKGRDDDDEPIFDDVESRLMREDYERDDIHMDDVSYGMGGANFNDSGEWADDDVSDAEGGGSDMDGEGTDDETEESSANEQSDEEFEGERTDEELDELLANTPLFDPPEFSDLLPPSAMEPEFSFRPEGSVYYPGMEYDPEELDITRPLPPRKRGPLPKEEISVEEVIDNADFRNVRYLTRFITESGNIIARKEFKMRNKSHNRIVKAIKTARFFGLMPYTNMGRPPYVFNEPFDELSEFYETDEGAERAQEPSYGGYYRGNYGNTTFSNDRYSRQGFEGLNRRNVGRKF